MASKALKGALGNMDIDKVDDMMADIQESQDVSNEIADAIARPMGFQVIFQIQSSVKNTRIIKGPGWSGPKFPIFFGPVWSSQSVLDRGPLVSRDLIVNF